jgi:hypothetical protein
VGITVMNRISSIRCTSESMIVGRSAVCFLGLIWIALGAHAQNTGCTPGQVVPYEPATVTLSGRIVVGKSLHPNGAQMVYPVLQLSKPVTVAGQAGPSNPVNAPEKCVREIQLYSAQRNIHKALIGYGSKPISVSGTLFHGHTAWHTRSIVMDVTRVN